MYLYWSSLICGPVLMFSFKKKPENINKNMLLVICNGIDLLVQTVGCILSHTHKKWQMFGGGK